MSKKKPPTPPQDIAHNLSLSLCGVDSHAHLDLVDFAEDRENVLARAKECGIAHIGNIFLNPHTFYERATYFEKHPEVFFVLGIHPCHAHECDENTLALMHNIFLQEKRLKAVGEIGLDFYWDDCPHDIQKKVFIAQLNLARELNKPVVLHSRDANEASLTLLEKEGFKNYPLLWHCFGGNRDEVEKIIANGWHISIPGPVSYPKNIELREAIKYIPLDKIMLETDCPYLSPQAWRGKRNEPAYTVYTVESMANALEMDAKSLWKICGDNAKNFFQLDA